MHYIHEDGGPRPPLLPELRARILEVPFEDLEETLVELSQEIITLEKVAEAQETDESNDQPDNDNVSGDYESGHASDDGWDPATEYGSEGMDDDDDATDNDTSELEIDRDFESGIEDSIQNAELEIHRNGGGFVAKVNTHSISSSWKVNRLGDRALNNAGKRVINTLLERESVLEAIGSYLIQELTDYLLRVNNKERHWYLRPLSMNKVLGDDSRSTVSRVVKNSNVLLPNNEIEDLSSFFDKTEMPISGKCIATEIGRLLQNDPKIKDKEIARHIELQAKQYGLDIKLSEKMAGYWRKKYKLS